MHAFDARLAYCAVRLKVAVSISHIHHTQTDPPSDLSIDLFLLKERQGNHRLGHYRASKLHTSAPGSRLANNVPLTCAQHLPPVSTPGEDIIWVK